MLLMSIFQLSKRGGGGCLLVSRVTMREKNKQQKTMIKGAFFELDSAQRCHHLW